MHKILIVGKCSAPSLWTLIVVNFIKGFTFNSSVQLLSILLISGPFQDLLARLFFLTRNPTWWANLAIQVSAPEEMRTQPPVISGSSFLIFFNVCCLFRKRQSEQLEAVRQADNPKAQNASSNSQADQTGAKAYHDLFPNNNWYKGFLYFKIAKA